MVDLHRPMRPNQMPGLRFGKVTPQMVMRLLSLITISLKYSPARLPEGNSFGRF
jgi:hypothetical protein